MNPIKKAATLLWAAVDSIDENAPAVMLRLERQIRKWLKENDKAAYAKSCYARRKAESKGEAYPARAKGGDERG